MGMYTELNIGVDFKLETPEYIIDIIKYMLVDGDLDITRIKKFTTHPLFKTPRWAHMLLSDSCYFDGFTDSSMVYDSILKTWQLNIRCNLKNYNDEILLFLDFIHPHLESEGFIGYTRFEFDILPTLIFNTPRGIELHYIEDFSVELVAGKE